MVCQKSSEPYRSCDIYAPLSDVVRGARIGSPRPNAGEGLGVRGIHLCWINSRNLALDGPQGLHQYGKKPRCDQCASPDEIDVNPSPPQQPNAQLFVHDPRSNCGHTEITGAMDQSGEQSSKGS